MQIMCPNCGRVKRDATGAPDEQCPSCGKVLHVERPSRHARATQRRDVRPPEESPDGVQITQRQIIGLVGAAALAIGVFAPLMSGPFGMNINYFMNGRGDGVFILALAAGATFYILKRRYRILWFFAGAVSVMLAWTFVHLQITVNEVSTPDDTDALGQGIASAVASTIQLQWGWALLLIGALLLFACAAMRTR